MLKRTVTYTDFNDVERTEDLYFNLSRTEAMDFLDLEPRIKAWQEKVGSTPRELSNAEVLEMLAILKEVVAQTYGVRSEDGKKFSKSPEIFRDFKDSAAYDELLWGLMTDPAIAAEFIIGLTPKGLPELSEAQLPPTDDAEVTTGGELNATQMEVPAWIREDREPTRAEMQKMSKEELQEAFRLRASRK